MMWWLVTIAIVEGLAILGLCYLLSRTPVIITILRGEKDPDSDPASSPSNK